MRRADTKHTQERLTQTTQHIRRHTRHTETRTQTQTHTDTKHGAAPDGEGLGNISTGCAAGALLTDVLVGRRASAANSSSSSAAGGAVGGGAARATGTAEGVETEAGEANTGLLVPGAEAGGGRRSGTSAAAVAATEMP